MVWVSEASYLGSATTVHCGGDHSPSRLEVKSAMAVWIWATRRAGGSARPSQSMASGSGDVQTNMISSTAGMRSLRRRRHSTVRLTARPLQ